MISTTSKNPQSRERFRRHRKRCMITKRLGRIDSSAPCNPLNAKSCDLVAHRAKNPSIYIKRLTGSGNSKRTNVRRTLEQNFFATASVTLRSNSLDTWPGVLSARDTEMGSTPASRATSCKVTAPLPPRGRVVWAGSPWSCPILGAAVSHRAMVSKRFSTGRRLALSLQSGPVRSILSCIARLNSLHWP